MKREYSKPTAKKYAVTTIKMIAASLTFGTDEADEADSKKQGPSMWEDMDEE